MHELRITNVFLVRVPATPSERASRPISPAVRAPEYRWTDGTSEKWMKLSTLV